MIDFFDTLYYLLTKDNNKGIVWKAMRFATRKFANVIIPIVYYLTRNNKQYLLKKQKEEHPQVIVSLTSFPARINDLWKVIESLLRQTYKPDRIVLWLSKEQFPEMSSLPQSLLNLQARGVEIKLREGDIRSHKKYYYTFSEHPNDICIVVDDDVFYRSDTIKTLMEYHKKYPNAVCCNLADIIVDEEGKVLPFEKRIFLSESHKPCYSEKILAIGVGGVLYPPGVLLKEVLNQKKFMEICPKADDLWLWAMTYCNKTPLAYSGIKMGFLPVEIKDNQMLTSYNLTGGNAKQLVSIKNYMKIQ